MDTWQRGLERDGERVGQAAPLAPPVGRHTVDAGDPVVRGRAHIGEVVVKEEHRAEWHPLPV